MNGGAGRAAEVRRRNFPLALLALAPHIGIVTDAPLFTFDIDADPLRERRFRWTIRKGLRVHLLSPQSFATRREANEDAVKALSRVKESFRIKK
jgi:hypothetical protein